MIYKNDENAWCKFLALKLLLQFWTNNTCNCSDKSYIYLTLFSMFNMLHTNLRKKQQMIYLSILNFSNMFRYSFNTNWSGLILLMHNPVNKTPCKLFTRLNATYACPFWNKVSSRHKTASFNVKPWTLWTVAAQQGTNGKVFLIIYLPSL